MKANLGKGKAFIILFAGFILGAEIADWAIDRGLNRNAGITHRDIAALKTACEEKLPRNIQCKVDIKFITEEIK